MGSLEESLAVSALNRRAEIEYVKVMAIVQAIAGAGKAAFDGAFPQDAMNKTLGSLQELMLPHWADETKKKALDVRRKIVAEHNKGPIQIKVMARDNGSKKGSLKK